MKKLLLIALLMFVCSQIQAQTKQVKITMKNGVTVKGDLKELNPTSHAIIVIAGIESKIQMGDVESIEELSSSSIGGNKESIDGIDTKQYGDYIITDDSQYPESFTMDIDGQQFTMMLVRGGVFNMGYNGRHSVSMKSEPVHKVTLSSYYVSKECVNRRLAMQLIGGNNTKLDKLDDYYKTKDWGKVNKIVTSIAEKKQKPYRLLTEAEWEYLSIMPFAISVFTDNIHAEWCSDFFGDYDASPQINPTGPSKGKSHVKRAFMGLKNKWDRSITESIESYIRIAIDANKIH